MIPFSLTVFTAGKWRGSRIHKMDESIIPPLSGSRLCNSTEKLSSSFGQQLIHDIASENRVDGAITGIIGTRSRQYERFEWLKNNAQEQELIALTDHSSPVVRVYAFYVLYEKRSLALSEICQKHIKDNATFLAVNGTNKSTRLVNECFNHMLQYTQ